MNKLEELSKEFGDKNKDIDEIVISIRKAIMSHANSLPEKYEPKSIIESRFTPAEEAYEKGIVSCGAMANIFSEILRHMGYKVKLIHGECKESVDHAWISVFNKESNTWKEFDLTREDTKILPTHIKKVEVESWEEIRSQTVPEHSSIRGRLASASVGSQKGLIRLFLNTPGGWRVRVGCKIDILVV